VVDREGIPLSMIHTAANVHDSKVLEEAVDAISPIRKPRRGRPRKRLKKLYADKAYDFPRCREALRKRGITSRIARRASTPARNWADTGGRWNERSRGSTASGG
jgi:IS5 family transposase